MDKFSTFLLGAITGVVALGVSAYVCDSYFSSSSSDDTTDSDVDGKNADSPSIKDTVSPDFGLIVR